MTLKITGPNIPKSFLIEAASMRKELRQNQATRIVQSRIVQSRNADNDDYLPELCSSTELYNS